jgi:hypothetical protein
MDSNGEHHAARTGDPVAARALHERAQAVAVPDFGQLQLQQCVEAIAAGPTSPRHHRGHRGEQADADAAHRPGIDATPDRP